MDLQRLEQKLAQHPGSPLFGRLAEVYLSLGRRDKAIEICLRNVERYPRYATPWLVIAQCYASENNYFQALEYLERARAIAPDASTLAELEKQWRAEIHRLEATPVREERDSLPEPSLPSHAESETVVEPPTLADAHPAPEVTSGVPVLPEDTTGESAVVQDLHLSEEELPQAPQEEVTVAPEPVAVVPDVSSESSELAPTGSHGSLSPDPIPPTESPRFEISQPHPEPPQPIEEIPPPLTNDRRIVSKTLAEIYAQQGAFEEAIITYQLLKELRPHQRGEYQRRIEELEGKRKEKHGS